MIDEEKNAENATAERLLLAHVEQLLVGGHISEDAARTYRLYLTNSSKSIRVFRNVVPGERVFTP